jgi:hypothetical protein
VNRARLILNALGAPSVGPSKTTSVSWCWWPNLSYRLTEIPAHTCPHRLKGSPWHKNASTCSIKQHSAAPFARQPCSCSQMSGKHKLATEAMLHRVIVLGGNTSDITAQSQSREWCSRTPRLHKHATMVQYTEFNRMVQSKYIQQYIRETHAMVI